MVKETHTGRGAPQFVLRLPQDLKDWLKHRAIDNRRSANGEILHRLEESRRLEGEASITQGAVQ